MKKAPLSHCSKTDSTMGINKAGIIFWIIFIYPNLPQSKNPEKKSQSFTCPGH